MNKCSKEKEKIGSGSRIRFLCFTSFLGT